MSDKLIYENAPIDKEKPRLRIESKVPSAYQVEPVYFIDDREVSREVFDSVVQAMQLEAITMVGALLRDTIKIMMEDE